MQNGKDMKLFNKIVSVVCMAAVLCSCENFFEKTSDTMLTEDDAYRDRTNVYASFIGVLGTIQSAADDLIIMSELRGELISPTGQAPTDYWDVFRYQERPDNPIVNPAPFYKIVMNANDFLRHAVAYQHRYPKVIPQEIYRQMIGGAICARTWAYLNIGKLYGEAIYYDYAMIGETDLSKVTPTKLKDLIPILINFMKTGVDGVNCMQYVQVDKMLELGNNNLVWKRMSIQPDALLTELYLWNGNYIDAVKTGIDLIAGRSLISEDNNNLLTCSYMFSGQYTGSGSWWNILFGAANNSTLSADANPFNNEILTVALYDYASNQTNQLQELFSPAPPNKYYLMPTKALEGKFDYKQDVYYYIDGVRYVNNPFKDNTRRIMTIDIEPGQLGEPVIRKYHSNGSGFQRQSLSYIPAYRHDKHIFIYRASEIFLMVSEALSNLGNLDAADALYNEGFAPYHASGSAFKHPFDAPLFSAAKFQASQGVRGRVGLPPLRSTDPRFNKVTPPYDNEPPTKAYTDRRKFIIDSIICEETARELAAEGKHWFTLLRMAINNDNPALLADVVCQKFDDPAEREYYRTLLRDPENWFIKYDFKLNKQ